MHSKTVFFSLTFDCIIDFNFPGSASNFSFICFRAPSSLPLVVQQQQQQCASRWRQNTTCCLLDYLSTCLTSKQNINSLYKFSNPLLVIPLLIPGFMYQYLVDVECIDENGGADKIHVFVLNKKSCVPIISAIVTMPVSEALMIEG